MICLLAAASLLFCSMLFLEDPAQLLVLYAESFVLFEQKDELLLDGTERFMQLRGLFFYYKHLLVDVLIVHVFTPN